MIIMIIFSWKYHVPFSNLLFDYFHALQMFYAALKILMSCTY